MKVEKVSDSGDFLKPKFIVEHKITELQIVDKESFQHVTFKGKDGKPDQQKLQCDVTFRGQGKEDPFEWTMNNKSRNILIDAWKDETDNWVDKKIPITIAGEGEMTHILVDKLRIE